MSDARNKTSLKSPLLAGRPDRTDEILALLADEANPDAAAPLVVDPAIPAQLAINELELSGQMIRLSTGDTGFVGVPVWLWIERDPDLTGPRSATAAVGNAKVTATGRLASVEWEVGPPGERVVCDGPGTPWTGQTGPSPDCGYVYELRSLPERTGGDGALADRGNDRLAGRLGRDLRRRAGLRAADGTGFRRYQRVGRRDSGRLADRHLEALRHDVGAADRRRPGESRRAQSALLGI